MRLVEDWAWAVMTIWQEAQGEPFSSKLAVAEVILRRTKMKYMSDGTVPGTCLWPLQFSGWNAVDATPRYRERLESARIDLSDPIVKDCLEAWRQAENGANTTNGALLYYNPKAVKRQPPWVAKCNQVAAIDNHLFLVEKRRTTV